MGDTTIEWTDKTWNPVTGCTKVSQGCKNCYAERLFPRPYPGRAFTDVQIHRDRLTQPLRWRKPRRIFVNSMSDLFHEAVSWEFLDAVFAVMALCPEHTFQVLTKRPQRMRDYLGERPNSPANGLHHRIARRFSELARNDDVQGFSLPLSNVWLGVSVEDQETADERIPLLLKTPAAIRFVSYEPALGPVDLSRIKLIDKARGPDVTFDALNGWYGGSSADKTKLDWVIAGGESGPKARPAHPDWFRSVRDQCAAAGVAFLFKQWGEWAPDDGSGGIPGLDRALRASQRGTVDASGEEMYRFGKKAAGRELDGRLHDEYPC